MSYTKGEWKAHGKQITCANEQNDVIAVAYEQALMPKGMAEANAHLIAAAPDLYQALNEVLGYAEEYGGMAFAGETGKTRDFFLQAIDMAQKALAKAEGK